jgi:hypothetical protein
MSRLRRFLIHFWLIEFTVRGRFREFSSGALKSVYGSCPIWQPWRAQYTIQFALSENARTGNVKRMERQVCRMAIVHFLPVQIQATEKRGDIANEPDLLVHPNLNDPKECLVPTQDRLQGPGNPNCRKPFAS